MPVVKQYLDKQDTESLLNDKPQLDMMTNLALTIALKDPDFPTLDADAVEKSWWLLFIHMKHNTLHYMFAKIKSTFHCS